MDIETAVVYGDAHVPHHDAEAVAVVCDVIEDINPDLLIEIGDMGEFDSINPHNSKKALLKEGTRLCKDIDDMLGVSNGIASYARDDCRKIKLLGNHENWLIRYIEERPELSGIVDLGVLYDVDGWEVIPWGEFFMYGSVGFHHGDRRGYKSIHHAKQWSAVGRSIVYGHHHDVQRFTSETLKKTGKPDKHGAFSIGCLSKLNRDWMKNNKSNWQQGFAVIYFHPDGRFNFYHVDITDGGCMFNGKYYGK